MFILQIAIHRYIEHWANNTFLIFIFFAVYNKFCDLCGQKWAVPEGLHPVSQDNPALALQDQFRILQVWGKETEAKHLHHQLSPERSSAYFPQQRDQGQHQSWSEGVYCEKNYIKWEKVDYLQKTAQSTNQARLHPIFTNIMNIPQALIH